MRRLSLKIYAALVGAIAIAVPLALVTSHLTQPKPVVPEAARAFVSEIADSMTALDRATRNRRLHRLGRRAGIEIGLYDREGVLIARTPRAPKLPSGTLKDGRLFRVRHGMAVLLSLDDTYWMVARRGHGPPKGSWVRLVTFLGVLAIALGLGSWWVARALAARLVRVRDGMDAWDGREATTLPMVGRDEVASVADAFNRATRRVRDLLREQEMMLATASHELRSPLTRIRLAGELMAGAADPEARQKHLASIAEEIEELDELVDQILAVSRWDSEGPPLVLEEVDLNALVTERAHRLNIALEVSTNGTDVRLQADRAQIMRLLDNLLVNVKTHALGSPAIWDAGTSNGYVWFSVSDRGPGFVDAQATDLFKPFRRGRGSQAPGTGLGLAIVQLIANRHGALVRAEATERGARFVVSEWPVSR